MIDFAERTRVAQTNALRDVLDRVASGELDPETVERTIVVSLVVENSRPAPAEISCDDAPIDGFALESTARQFRLDPARSEPVSISVGLPSTPTHDPVDAGTVMIRGQDERDLVVWIRAEVDALPDPPALDASPAPPLAVPEGPAPETPAPETPAPETPAPETPAT